MLVLSYQAGVSNADADHGGTQRGGSERCQRAAEGQRPEGPAAGVHRGRGGEVKLCGSFFCKLNPPVTPLINVQLPTMKTLINFILPVCSY